MTTEDLRSKFVDSLRRALKVSGLWQFMQPKAIDALFLHFELMLEWNKAYRLTAITNPDDAAIKLYADSLAALPLLSSMPEGGDFLDVGSGAGFPGIPLAIAYPNRRFVLAERNGKKATFLRFALRRLNLSARVSVLQTDVSELHFPSGAWAAILSKATFSDVSWIRWANRFLLPGGATILFLTEDKISLASSMGFGIKDRFDYTLPGMSKHRSVIAFGPEER